MQNTSRLLRRAFIQYRPYTVSTRASPLLRASLPRPLNTTRPQYVQPSIQRVRFETSLTAPESKQASEGTEKRDVPSYQLTFTCKPCKHRSTHSITKQGYHHGTVLIQCPNCKSRHVISDHLKIFMDEASTLEDILQRTAGTTSDLSKLLKKGRLGQRQGQLVGNEGEEDLEFWEDGTTSKHNPPSDS